MSLQPDLYLSKLIPTDMDLPDRKDTNLIQINITESKMLGGDLFSISLSIYLSVCWYSIAAMPFVMGI